MILYSIKNIRTKYFLKKKYFKLRNKKFDFVFVYIFIKIEKSKNETKLFKVFIDYLMENGFHEFLYQLIKKTLLDLHL